LDLTDRKKQDGDMYITIIKYLYNNRLKEDEMSRACSMYREEETFIQGFVRRHEGKRPLGRRKIIWEIILKWIINRL
jgi:hypothetical protein